MASAPVPTLGVRARLATARLLARALPPLLGPRAVLRACPPHLLPPTMVLHGRAAPGGAPLHSDADRRDGWVEVTLLGLYEWRSLVVAQVLCGRGDRIVEVGAHVGSETIGFASIVGTEGRVDAYEPLPANVEAITDALAHAGLTQVRLRPCAVDAEPGAARFTLPDDTGNTLAGHLLAPDGATDRGTVDVEVVTLDADLGAPGDVRLLAVDAEGADLGVLQGARELVERSRPALIVEALPPDLDPLGRAPLGAMADLLGSWGYRLWRIERLGLTPLARDGDLGPRQTGQLNWLALADDDIARAPTVHRAIRRAALLPRAVGPLR